MAPRFVAAGWGFCGATTRSLGDDSAIHEDLLLDVGAVVQWLKERRGVKQVVLLGNSGGGALMTFYQAQAALPPRDRLSQTAAGDATSLRSATLPEGDALLLVAAHRGPATVLSRSLDPSVTREEQPLYVEELLDMYHPRQRVRRSSHLVTV